MIDRRTETLKDARTQFFLSLHRVQIPLKRPKKHKKWHSNASRSKKRYLILSTMNLNNE
jgi:hypothetical protein